MGRDAMLARCRMLLVIVLLISTAFGRDPDPPGEWVRELDEDVPILLLDDVGRPVSSARVCYSRELGHIPDQRTAVTDESGLAVLRDIDPDRLEHDEILDGHDGGAALSGLDAD